MQLLCHFCYFMVFLFFCLNKRDILWWTKTIYDSKIWLFITSEENLCGFHNHGTNLKRSKYARMRVGDRSFMLHLFVFIFADPAGDPRHARIPERTFLTKMQKALGPLGMLYKYMEERTRVKVSISNLIFSKTLFLIFPLGGFENFSHK